MGQPRPPASWIRIVVPPLYQADCDRASIGRPCRTCRARHLWAPARIEGRQCSGPAEHHGVEFHQEPGSSVDKRPRLGKSVLGGAGQPNGDSLKERCVRAGYLEPTEFEPGS